MTQVNTNTIMLSVVVALGLVLVVGLVVIPVIHEAQAISSTALDRRKGVQGDSSSGGKRQGRGINL
jgi:hypothetical protein